MSVTLEHSDSFDLISESQAMPLLEAQRTANPWRSRTMRIRWIRKAILERKYETSDRLDSAVEALMQDMIAFGSEKKAG